MQVGCYRLHLALEGRPLAGGTYLNWARSQDCHCVLGADDFAADRDFSGRKVHLAKVGIQAL
jgi:hypothetical protein